jgi:hypothetical protein
MFVYAKYYIDMKRLLFVSLLVGTALAFTSCMDTTDCYCEYNNGESTMVNDWNGDCSEITLTEFMKKAAPGQATYVGCIDM